MVENTGIDPVTSRNIINISYITYQRAGNGDQHAQMNRLSPPTVEQLLTTSLLTQLVTVVISEEMKVDNTQADSTARNALLTLRIKQ